jgi:Uma2 family endonuclease
MATVSTEHVPEASNHRSPPLQSGDRLTRAEFERRYDAMPQLKKAELIEGVVYVGSPVSHRHHSNPHFNLIYWLGTYAAGTSGVEGGDNGSLRLDLDNEPQPDAYLIVLPTHGGGVQLDERGYIIGAPELVAEVAASGVSYDLHDKLNAYRRNGVREYVVWRVHDRTIDWFILRDGRYDRLALTAAGHYQSEVLPGLRLDPAALVSGDLMRVAQVVQQGIATPEPAAFVARLQQTASQSTP